MAIPQPASEPDGASERIRRAAIALFRERGYHGTPVRELARIVKIEAASLYYHFPSKQTILLDILDRTLDDLLGGLARATGDMGGAEGRLRAAVRFHVLFHSERRDEAFVSHSELRSLTPPNLRRIVAKRDRYERAFRAILTGGVKAGVFAIPDVKLAAAGILTMCTGVASWYSDHGRLRPEAIAERYVEMILRIARGAGRPVERRLKRARAR